MSLFVASLNSGSNGNCYYISNGHEAVLVDAGISCRETEKRMAILGLPMSSIKAVLITHEHTDHVSGVFRLSKRYNLPVYINAGTLKRSRLPLPPEQVRSFANGDTIAIHGMKITAFSKHHDAADPCSFTITAHGVTVGVFTDLGCVCDNLIHHFSQCHAALLESNYDTDMLETGRYPYHLKQRIRGGKGHLSNAEAAELFRMHKPAHMTHLFLAHLSKENNAPELATAAFAPYAGTVQVLVASRYAAGEVYEICLPGGARAEAVERYTQASLF